MTAVEPVHIFRDFAAPRADGSALLDPSPSELPHRLAANRQLAATWPLQLLGYDIADIRRRARTDLLRAAVRYTRAYRDLPASVAASEADGEIPLAMAGHQPELFHPGVWFKNFVLSRVGHDSQGVAVNLIVDNDLSGAPSVRAPTLEQGHLTRLTIPYDGSVARVVPFEQRWIADRSLFDSFDTRLRETLRGVVSDPAVIPLWKHARRAADRCSNIGCSLAQARHALEGELGLTTLELPISAACRSWSFAAFVLNLVDDLPRLRTGYNESLYAYRAAHAIRSSAHPVPALDRQDQWYEIPLWIYGDDDPRRRAAWARRVGTTIELSDRNARCVRIETASGPGDSIDQLLAAMGSTFKVRPRALVTTMFARLVLSDLFLHGIGGAKYDQLGDMIIRRLFGVEPPSYGVLSATVLLPGARSHFAENVEREIVRELRDLRFSPERFADRAPIPADLLDRKRRLLENIPPRGAKSEWHQSLDAVNRRMRTYLDDVASDLTDQMRKAHEELREDQLWRSREHAFPIHPLGRMREIFDRLLGAT